MPTSPAGVAYVECDGSPTLRFTRTGMNGSRRFLCAWSDALTLARELIGSYTRSGIVVTAVPPLAFPGFPGLFVSDLAIDPHMPDSPDGDSTVSLDGATNTYDNGSGGAILTVTYTASYDAQSSSNGPEIPEGTTIVISGDLGTEVYSTPGRTWRWGTVAGNPQVDPDTFAGIVIPTGEFNVTWGRVPLPPWDTIRAARGKVNDREFLRAPAGTLLFRGPNFRRMFQFLDDTELWELTYRFGEVVKTRNDGTEVGWNYFYREQASGSEHWHSIQNESGDPPFGQANFEDLFKFDIVTP